MMMMTQMINLEVQAMNFYNVYDTQEDVTYEHLRRGQVIELTGISKKTDVSAYAHCQESILSRYIVNFENESIEPIKSKRIDEMTFSELLINWDKTVTELRRKLCLSK